MTPDAGPAFRSVGVVTTCSKAGCIVRTSIGAGGTRTAKEDRRCVTVIVRPGT